MTTTVNLRAEAEAEVRRLTASRAIGGHRRDAMSQGLWTHGPLVGRARGARRRRALGGGALFIWRVACEDAAGRSSPPAIVAAILTLDFGSASGDAASRLQTLVNGVAARLPAAIERATRSMQQALADGVRRHALARLERERAIAADVKRTPPAAAYQAGLFDHRAERAHHERVDAAQQAGYLASSRIDAATAATALHPIEPTLLLVLTA